MEDSVWLVSSNPVNSKSYQTDMKEEPLATDVSAMQNPPWHRDDDDDDDDDDDCINVAAEPVVEIKTAGDYLEGVETHDRGGRGHYPFHSEGVVGDFNKDELDLMLMYNEGNRLKENELPGRYQDKRESGMEPTIYYTKHKAQEEEEEEEDGLCEKTGLLFSHSILEPETSDPQQSLLSISDMSSTEIMKSFNSPSQVAASKPVERGDQMSNCYSDRYRSACPFCGEMFTHVIAHMMTAHSDAPLVAEAMSHEKGSPQRRALFIALKNKGNFLHDQFSQGDDKEVHIPTETEEDPVNSSQKVTCKYCSRVYKTRKIRYHYMKCSAYKESTNHNTFTFRREMRKQDHYKKCMNILQTFPFVHEKVASEILARMRQDKITTHILNDPLLLKYAEVNSQGDVMPSFLHKVKQDLRKLGKLILALKEKDDRIQYMADVLKPSSFGLVVHCVREHSGFNSATCSYARTSTPRNTGYILRKCTELLKEEALKTMDEGLVQQCNEFTDLMINDWRDCMNLDVARNRKRERLPLPKDIRKLQLYFDKEMNLIIKKLAETQAASHWRRLSRLTLASIVLFNRGSSRKIDRMTMSDFENGCSAETTLPELEDKLSLVERQSVSNLTRISIYETPGKKVPILLKPMHMQAIKMMSEMRGTVGVVDNPYVFARPGGETPLRGDVIREFVHRAGLEQPNNITPSNLRKHVIITNHLTAFSQSHETEQIEDQTDENSRDNSYEAEDYSQYDAQTNSETREMAEENIVEPDRVSLAEPENGHDECATEEESQKKEFNLRDNGNRHWFLEYNSSDFEFENGDDSDYEPARKKEKVRGSRNRRKGPRKRMVVEKTHQVDDLLTGANVPAGTNARQYIRGKTRYTYCRWTEEEETIVFNTMDHHFKSGTLPGKRECLQVMEENRILEKRKWEDIKNFVRNKMVRLARTNSALQNSVREFCSTTLIPHSSD